MIIAIFFILYYVPPKFISDLQEFRILIVFHFARFWVLDKELEVEIAKERADKLAFLVEDIEVLWSVASILKTHDVNAELTEESFATTGLIVHHNFHVRLELQLLLESNFCGFEEVVVREPALFWVTSKLVSDISDLDLHYGVQLFFVNLRSKFETA